MDPAYRVELVASHHLALLARIEAEAAAIFPDEDIAPELRREGLPLDFFERAAAERRLWTAVEIASGKPVGFAVATLVDGSAHLFEMDVLPGHGRRGLGAALVEAVAEWAREQGHSSLSLTTFRHLSWNAPFYRRLGFEEISEDALTPGLSDCLESEARDGLDRSKRVAMRRMTPTTDAA
jgi:GNAT superfamily N-acetyltransferase